MTAIEKAKELIEEMKNTYLTTSDFVYDSTAKQCALIAVDEIMKQCFDYRDIDLQASYDYWLEVKQEIEKL